MPPAPRQRCPSCGEDLRDRPPPNSCPDCGFTYDPTTLVWSSPLSRTRLALTYAAGGLAVGLAIALFYPAGTLRAVRAALPLALGLAAAGAGLALRRVISGRINNRFVAIDTRGIVIGLRAQPQLVPWDDVDRVVVQRGVPKLQRLSNPALLPLEDVFENPHDVETFVAAVRDRRQRG